MRSAFSPNSKLPMPVDAADFELASYFAEADIDRPIATSQASDSLLSSRSTWTPRELHSHLKSVYSESIGYCFDHITDPRVRQWVTERIESSKQTLENTPKEVHEQILETISESQAFSDFCERKFSVKKRFGGEGIDTGVLALKELVRGFHEKKGKEFVLGMSHRGRLNSLVCVLKKPYQKMFVEFLEKPLEFLKDLIPGFYGDVKYHNGYKSVDVDQNGNELRLEMLPNPSHLEAVNPVVMGYSRGLAEARGDHSGAEVLPVLTHGDAAFAGQGVVYETLQMEQLRGYSVGGTVHLVFNNQVGFTTNPLDGRSTRYATDIARFNENLMLLVNANDPVAVRQVARLALDYRSEFKKDVFIEIMGFRKYGHNEQDNPRFTQPVMYQKVDSMPTVHTKYTSNLIASGIFTQAEIDAKYNAYSAEIERHYERARSEEIDPANYYERANQFAKEASGVQSERLRELARKVYTLDLKDFELDKTVSRIYKNSLKAVEDGKGIGWATAEHLAYASLLEEGHSVRVSGEDCERGTFSHRHAVMVDKKTGAKYFPLSAVLPAERSGDLTIVNSLLSEYGVMGYDFGYSLARQDALTIWEAQFGDFANGGQIIIDQFLLNSEKKWSLFSGLVLLLPHGYDGNGPEHSNARVERFLSNIDDDYMRAASSQDYRDRLTELTNAQVCNMTTAANFFHALRGQVKKPHRKPLIVMSPKKILMSKEVQSPLEDFGPEGAFQPLINDTPSGPAVKKVLLCSGQVYFDLKNRRTQLGLEGEVAIIRIERLGPFPYNEFVSTVKGLSADAEFVFVSEENFNFSAFSYVEPRVNMLLQECGFENDLQYVGRGFSSSTSTGIEVVHRREYETLINEALDKLPDSN